ncbi:hypothetical protein CAter282_2805 [Collimonas arenae]|uniref:Transmembrane protein n=1 Tax=Collimonas arenae TaxID=279058 RepID=A0A127QKC5_9BURK|nr:DUF2818 family protein [Collimonas arenae]AMP00642.1 hypothetical protein CAter10_3092 [Collimonas arenae]AMP10530.1 hypothetical protein CAter282_2805 [Collimonas arenae]
MNVSLSSLFVILLALIAANLPFFNERVFALVPIKSGAQGTVKPVWVRLLELLALYALVGLFAHLLEANIGNTFSQGWEFYAVTGCMFLVLAYPGYVLRYLKKHR